MLRFFFLVLLSWHATATVAQQAKDSFLIKLKQHPQQDSIRVELLIDACVGSTFSADTAYLQWSNEALQLSQQLNYRAGKIRALNCIGNYYYQRAIYNKATPYYIDALTMAETDKDENSIINGKSNLANVYNHINRGLDAVKMLQECDEILKNRKDTASQKRAAILTNLATSYSTLNYHDKAIYFYTIVLNICRKQDIKFGIGLSLSNLGSESYSLKNYTAAIAYLKEADKVARANDMDFLKGSIARYLGQTYIALGSVDKGIALLQEALKIGKAANDGETLTDVYSQLYKAYAISGRYQQAYENSLLHFTLKDSIYGLDREKAINELSTRYETEKKERLIQSLTQDKKITSLQSQRKTVLIYSISGAIILLVLLTYILFNRYKIKQLNKQLLEKITHEQQLNQSILTSIKAQMNPHFIFNALNTIQHFIYGNDKSKAVNYLGKFSELVRTVLDNSSKERIPLSAELTFLTLYLNLEKMRFEDSLEVIIDDCAAIEEDKDDIMIPSMIIQPYVENAFKHGLLHKKDNRQVSIRFSINEISKILTCVVEDNGVGRKQSEAYKLAGQMNHSSFATSATQKRLELLNQGRKDSIAVLFEDKTDDTGNATGTKVTIAIPYILVV